MRRIPILLITLASFLSSSALCQDSPELLQDRPQSNIQIRGSIRDTDGSPIDDANIMIWPDSNQQYQSEQDGFFEISNLPSNAFALIVESNGYHPFVRSRIKLLPGQIPRVDIVMIKNVGARTQLIFENPTEDEVVRYQPILTSFREPPFFSTKAPVKPVESYRFLWMRSFDPYILIHLEILDDSNAIVTFKELKENKDGSKSKLTVNKTSSLSKIMSKEVKKFGVSVVKETILAIRQVAEDEFWNQPFRIDNDRIVLDGSECVVEGYRSSEHHLIYRWSPIEDEKDPVGHFIKRLIQVSGKRFYYDEVY